jgi:hypothetical protein
MARAILQADSTGQQPLYRRQGPARGEDSQIRQPGQQIGDAHTDPRQMLEVVQHQQESWQSNERLPHQIVPRLVWRRLHFQDIRNSQEEQCHGSNRGKVNERHVPLPTVAAILAGEPGQGKPNIGRRSMANPPGDSAGLDPSLDDTGFRSHAEADSHPRARRAQPRSILLPFLQIRLRNDVS